MYPNMTINSTNLMDNVLKNAFRNENATDPSWLLVHSATRAPQNNTINIALTLQRRRSFSFVVLLPKRFAEFLNRVVTSHNCQVTMPAFLSDRLMPQSSSVSSSGNGG